MKFDFLHTSLDNFGEVTAEELTDYDVLILMEQLLKDVKIETGRDISQLEMGDESLPTVMVRILRSILTIYNAKKDSLTRNRSRLDEKVAECRQAEAELRELESANVDLRAMEASLSRLSEELEEAREARRNWEHVDTEIQKARQELETLRQFDCAQAHGTLSTLRAQCAATASETEALQKELQEVTDHRHRLEAQKAELADKVARKKGELQAVSASCSELSETERQLVETQCEQKSVEAELLQKTDGLRREIDEFLSSRIHPLQQEVERLEEEKQSKTVCEEELKKRKAEVSSAISKINATNDELDEAEGELLQKHQKLQEKRQTLTQVQAQLEAMSKELRTIETEIYETDNLNREQKAAKEAAEKRLLQKREVRKLLEKEVAQASAALETLTGEAAPLEKKAEELRTEHAALATSTGLLRDEIDSLEIKIRELRDTGIESRAKTYRKQLEEEQKKLETAQAECGVMEEQILYLSEKLTEISAKRAELSKIVDDNRKNLDAIGRVKDELSRSVTAEYLKEARALASRLEKLSWAHENLCRAVASMTGYLGAEPIKMEYSIRQGLSMMSQKINQLSEAMVRCADSLKLEEI